MKVVVAIDSFKGSMTSMEAGQAAEKGIRNAFAAKNKDVDVIVKPLADGGEGTTTALTEGLGGRIITVEVPGPLGEMVNATYGILDDGCCVMEMAEAAGITLIKELNPEKASTYGVGLMIKDAIEKGCRKFIIGIGGSATTDGGTGMLSALGYKLIKKDGTEISRGICELDLLDKISIADNSIIEILKECSFEIACDVNNPLCGKKGAVAIFGPQKGVSKDNILVYDSKMKHYADIAENFTGEDHTCDPGAGAAGGLGFAFKTFIPGAELKPGIDIVLNAIGLEEEIKDADIVVTGEGRLDGQTAMGKVPIGVAKLAKEYDCKVIAFAGGVAEDAKACNDQGIDAFFPIVRGVTTLEEAMSVENAKNNMEAAVEQVFNLL